MFSLSTLLFRLLLDEKHLHMHGCMYPEIYMDHNRHRKLKTYKAQGTRSFIYHLSQHLTPFYAVRWADFVVVEGRYSFERMHVAKQENLAVYGKIYKEK